jgi:hypothetical protein
MRQSVILLLCSLAGVLGGAAIIGLPALGAAIIFDSLCVGVFALVRDDGTAEPGVHEAGGTLHSVLERARAAS